MGLQRNNTTISSSPGEGNKEAVPRGNAASVFYRIRHSLRPFALPLLLLLGTVFYYFGELVDWTAWEALRREFFYSVHDIHRLFFIIPIIYAAYHARVKGALIITLVSFLIFLPRALFISPYPDPLLRMLIFTIFAGALGCLTAVIRNKSERVEHLEAIIEHERDKLSGILNSMADGVLITGPDYKIRFMNSRMVGDFGEGMGLPCYQHLHHLDAPCHQDCRILQVIGRREVARWHDDFPDGRTFEIVSSPYIDSDGVTCQLSMFRDASLRKER